MKTSNIILPVGHGCDKDKNAWMKVGILIRIQLFTNTIYNNKRQATFSVRDGRHRTNGENYRIISPWVRCDSRVETDVCSAIAGVSLTDRQEVLAEQSEFPCDTARLL